jgi:hypothetical protein
MEGDFKNYNQILPSPPLEKAGINLDYPVTLHALGNEPGNDK